MLVLHVPLQVELFELRESAEAEEADDLPPEVVAQVPLRPYSLEGPAVIDAVCYRLNQIVSYSEFIQKSQTNNSIFGTFTLLPISSE